jgi:LAO/AO transport system kinase
MAIKNYNTNELFDGIKRGDRASLARAITLVESELTEHRKLAAQLLQKCNSLAGNSFRLGITGVPGAGKSTFIENFGIRLCEQGKKVGVIAIDPTSTISKGSILGDKTRMEKLSRHANAFIRPSPSSGYLGGIHAKSRETIVLMEAAGFEYVLIETVGVGQSETEVKSICDFFLLLMIAGAGDELQGIKRGIMEMADGIIIHKADGENKERAMQAQADYASALHLFPISENQWAPQVKMASSLSGEGLEEVQKMIHDFRSLVIANKSFEKNRVSQNIAWLHRLLQSKLLNDFYSEHLNKEKVKQAENALRSNQSDVYSLFYDLFEPS